MMSSDLRREQYLKRIRPFYSSDLVKIITGVRRCGKSTILKQIQNEIVSNGVDRDHIIAMNFELMDNRHIDSGEKLHHHVRQLMNDSGMYYMFFDEIQEVDGFEKAINSLRTEFGCSIFITGSNGKLLSNDITTVMTGRFVEFRIMPFTFKEALEFKQVNNIPVDDEIAFLEEYIRLGGMPQRFTMTERDVKLYLSDLKTSIIGKDILLRSRITNVDLLNRMLDFILNNSGKVFSANSVKNFIKSEGRSVSNETVYNYMDAILSSLLVSRIRRFDIKGKEMMRLREKYYAVDTGIWHSDRLTGEMDLGASIETIVCNELISRGYKVSIGDVNGKEIDFVIEKEGKRMYIQVTYLMTDKDTREREFASLEAIRDNYPKYVLSMDRFDMSQNGIIHKNLIDFLISDEF